MLCKVVKDLIPHSILSDAFDRVSYFLPIEGDKVIIVAADSDSL